jgi:hypothetical protein
MFKNLPEFLTYTRDMITFSSNLFMALSFFFQCSHQRSELEKKLSSFTFQEGSSTDSNILVKHLQEELRNFVSLVSTHTSYSDKGFCYFQCPLQVIW